MHHVVAWLLEPDEPAGRAEALRVFEGAPDDHPRVAAAREASRERGAVARLAAALAAPLGEHAALYLPKYNAPWHQVIALADLGAPFATPGVAEAFRAMGDAFVQPDGGIGRHGGHLCLTGNYVRAAHRFGLGDEARTRDAAAWLVRQQMADGGWHCWPEDFEAGTLDAWEALHALAHIPVDKRPEGAAEAIARGLEFMLDARLGVGDPYEPWARLHHPRHYHYDVLAGLETVAALGAAHDERAQAALDWLEAKRQPDGRWAADVVHPDIGAGTDYTPHPPGFPAAATPLVIEEPGVPSKWLTLAALRVLHAAGRWAP